MPLVCRQQDLRDFPNIENYVGSHFAIADGHANTFRLARQFIAAGILKCDVETYQAFFDVYYELDYFAFSFRKSLEGAVEKLRKYERKVLDLLDKMTVDPLAVREYLDVGDKYADRGPLDTLTMALYRKLEDAGLEFKILASNHDWEMIKLYFWLESGSPLEDFQTAAPCSGEYDEATFDRVSPFQALVCDKTDDRALALSLENMLNLMKDPEHGGQYQASFKLFMAETYLPRLNFFRVVPDDDGRPCFFTHGFFEESNLIQLCENLHIKYLKNDEETFGKTITQLNKSLIRLFNHDAHAFFKQYSPYLDQFKAYRGDYLTLASPFLLSFWRRPDDPRAMNDVGFELDNGVIVKRGFGHIGPVQNPTAYRHLVPLDTDWGKYYAPKTADEDLCGDDLSFVAKVARPEPAVLPQAAAASRVASVGSSSDEVESDDDDECGDIALACALAVLS